MLFTPVTSIRPPCGPVVSTTSVPIFCGPTIGAVFARRFARSMVELVGGVSFCTTSPIGVKLRSFESPCTWMRRSYAQLASPVALLHTVPESGVEPGSSHR